MMARRAERQEGARARGAEHGVALVPQAAQRAVDHRARRHSRHVAVLRVRRRLDRRCGLQRKIRRKELVARWHRQCRVLVGLLARLRAQRACPGLGLPSLHQRVGQRLCGVRHVEPRLLERQRARGQFVRRAGEDHLCEAVFARDQVNARIGGGQALQHRRHALRIPLLVHVVARKRVLRRVERHGARQPAGVLVGILLLVVAELHIRHRAQLVEDPLLRALAAQHGSVLKHQRGNIVTPLEALLCQMRRHHKHGAVGRAVVAAVAHAARQRSDPPARLEIRKQRAAPLMPQQVRGEFRRLGAVGLEQRRQAPQNVQLHHIAHRGHHVAHARRKRHAAGLKVRREGRRLAGGPAHVGKELRHPPLQLVKALLPHHHQAHARCAVVRVVELQQLAPHVDARGGRLLLQRL
mmetsp:Transcript_6351/g.19065  ORF Transcript_6351/g.19065 Transcript_6351/m.19065 type:complete len:409 (+) Transcript_6351:1369-2595(+)